MRRLITAIILLSLSVSGFAQRTLSADVEVKEVAGGKVTTTRKHVCCNASGRLVSYFNSPVVYYSIATSRGDARIYLPASKEYYTDHTGSVSSKDDLMYLFLSRAMGDMGLLKYGYSLRSSTTDSEGYLVKTFVGGSIKGDSPVVEVVYKDYLPVYIAHKSQDGTVRGKLYFSSYTPCGNLVFPCRVTEIVYPSAKDSIVSRTIYSNLAADSQDPLATFEIPADAKPLALPKK